MGCLDETEPESATVTQKQVENSTLATEAAVLAMPAYFNHFDSKYPDANMILQMNLLGFRMAQIPAVMHRRMHGTGMHSGIIKPIKYMFRSTASVCAVWARMKLLHEKA